MKFPLILPLLTSPTRRFALLGCCALAAAFTLAPAVGSAQTRDRGDRYQRATGGSGGSSSSSSSSNSRSAAREPSRNESRAAGRSAPREQSRGTQRPAFSREQYQRDDGRSRTRTDDNSRGTSRSPTFRPDTNARPSSPSRGESRYTPRADPRYDSRGADYDRGDRYQRARVVAGRDYGSTSDYRRYDRNDDRYDNRRGGYGYYRPYYGGGYYNAYYGGYRPYGYRSGLSVDLNFGNDDRYYNDYRYDGYRSYGYAPQTYGYAQTYTPAGGVFADDPYHLPDSYVAPAYYYQTYGYSPVYGGYDAAPAYGGYGYGSSYDDSYGGGVTTTYSYSASSGFVQPRPFVSYGATYSTAGYRPFAFGCAPRTRVSYGVRFATGPRYYPRYSYGPSVSVGVGYRY